MFARRLVNVIGPLAFVAAFAATAAAHPAPFSYIDVHVGRGSIQVSVVAHDFDLGHDLGTAPPEALLDPAVLAQKSAAMRALVEDRLHLFADGRLLKATAAAPPEALPERQSVRLSFQYDDVGTPGAVTLETLMFPYDPNHQTFVNFYDGEKLGTQAILDAGLTRFEFLAGSAGGMMAGAFRFLREGARHILSGPDHLLFLVGITLVGGSMRRLALIVSVFTAAHLAALTLAMLHVMMPSQRILEPAVALSIVYLGADNLLVHGGRDVRAWIALAFGFIHGFSVAIALGGIGFSGGALGAALAGLNAGIETAQLVGVAAAASALAALRSRSEWARQQLAVVGSVIVIAAGAFWFVERVFFPGGFS